MAGFPRILKSPCVSKEIRFSEIHLPTKPESQTCNNKLTPDQVDSAIGQAFFIAATTCSGRERSAWDISCFIKKYPPTRLVAALDVFYNATITSIGGVSMKKIIALGLTVAICVGLLAGCGTVGSNKKNPRTITDSAGRQVEVPEKAESIVCVGVGALRYTCYVGAQDLVVGVEDCEVKPGMTRLYNYVNFDPMSYRCPGQLQRACRSWTAGHLLPQKRTCSLRSHLGLD